jgi:predicted SnoaL-like aldol condensation-catalyzing enzyme
LLSIVCSLILSVEAVPCSISFYVPNKRDGGTVTADGTSIFSPQPIAAVSTDVWDTYRNKTVNINGTDYVVKDQFISNANTIDFTIFVPEEQNDTKMICSWIPEKHEIERPEKHEIERPEKHEIERPEKHETERPERHETEHPKKHETERPEKHETDPKKHETDSKKHEIERPKKHEIERPEKHEIERPKRHNDRRGNGVDCIVTFYTNSKEENDGYSTTADGSKLLSSRNIAAVSKHAYGNMKGKELRVMGKTYTVHDSCGTCSDNVLGVDILVGTSEEARRLGMRRTTCEVLS